MRRVARQCHERDRQSAGEAEEEEEEEQHSSSGGEQPTHQVQLPSLPTRPACEHALTCPPPSPAALPSGELRAVFNIPLPKEPANKASAPATP